MQIHSWTKFPSWVKHTRHYFVLSDTHGRAAEFRRLLDKQPAGSQLVHLGDIGDRGPDSLACYGELDARPDAILLTGNHELFIDSYFFQPASENFKMGLKLLWARNGGDKFYEEMSRDFSGSIELVKRIINRQIPAHIDGNIVFCHAGLHKEDDFQEALVKKSLTEKNWDTLCEKGRFPCFAWGMNDEVFTYPETDNWNGIDFKPFFVHGHRRVTDIEEYDRPRTAPWRIGCDWLHGLAALEIKNGHFRFYDQVSLTKE